SLMDGRGRGSVGNRTSGRCDVGNKAGELFVTTFGDMDLISDPLVGVFATEMRFPIIRRAEEHPRWRDAVFFRTPTEPCRSGVVLLPPDALQCVARGHPAQPHGCLGRVDGHQQPVSHTGLATPSDSGPAATQARRRPDY